MTEQTSPGPTTHRPAIRATAAAVSVLVLIVAAGAIWDPSGLLAPVGGRGLPPMGTGGVYRWAPLLVGLPVLLVATAVPILALARKRAFLITWIAVTGAAALAAAATGLVSAIP